MRLKVEDDAVHFLRFSSPDHGLDGAVYRPPELYDLRIGSTPGINQRLQFVLCHTGLDCAHCDHRALGAAVSTGQLALFALLAEFTVLSVFYDFAVKHSLGGFAVDVTAVFEYLHPPGLACKPREYACLDRRKVGNDILVAGRRNEGGSYQLA